MSPANDLILPANDLFLPVLPSPLLSTAVYLPPPCRFVTISVQFHHARTGTQRGSSSQHPSTFSMHSTQESVIGPFTEDAEPGYPGQIQWVGVNALVKIPPVQLDHIRIVDSFLSSTQSLCHSTVLKPLPSFRQKVTIIAIYDTVLTFPQEVRFIWTGKLRGITLLYVTARLSMLLYQILFPIVVLTPLWEKVVLSNALIAEISSGAIFGVTWYHTWTLVKLRKSFPDMTSRKSLSSLILQQGVLRFMIITYWILQIIITDNPTVRGLSTLTQRPISILLVLRFFLDLRERNAHLIGTSHSWDVGPYSSFKAVAGKISNRIIEDLGDLEDEVLFTSPATSSWAVSGQVLHPSNSKAENNDSTPAVDLGEFPWAGGRLEPGTGNTHELGKRFSSKFSKKLRQGYRKFHEGNTVIVSAELSSELLRISGDKGVVNQEAVEA
ncbi:hypothetical protein BU17DRAFT_69974 [Hysterangium stoloniferum]|nr:hypothetical protein BU17DRAFT_69974 [Hysterangium stoloniferum]